MDYYLSYTFLLSILQIIWIDLLLSGDNAVVIALACRSLPPERQKLGIALGAGTAVGLRIIMAALVTYLLAVPYLRIVGGLLLCWIAIGLVKSGEDEEHHVKESTTLLSAVRTIAIADLVMSLDNVVAVAGAARGNMPAFIFGLAVSIPILVVGASMITALLQRFPFLIWAGGALLGWVAGEMIVTDPSITALVHNYGDIAHYGAATAGAILVLAVGFAWSWLNERAVKATT